MILVFGNGQLGQELTRTGASRRVPLITLSRAQARYCQRYGLDARVLNWRDADIGKLGRFDAVICESIDRVARIVDNLYYPGDGALPCRSGCRFAEAHVSPSCPGSCDQGYL